MLFDNCTSVRYVQFDSVLNKLTLPSVRFTTYIYYFITMCSIVPHNKFASETKYVYNFKQSV